MTGAKVKDGSLSAADINLASLSGVPPARTPRTPVPPARPGPGDLRQPAGVGRPGDADGDPTAPTPTIIGGSAACPPGTFVVGGGVGVDDFANTAVVDSFPQPGGHAWTARVDNNDPDGGARLHRRRHLRLRDRGRLSSRRVSGGRPPAARHASAPPGRPRVRAPSRRGDPSSGHGAGQVPGAASEAWAVSQISLPFRIALVAMLAVCAVWFTVLRPKPPVADAPLPAAPGTTGLAHDVAAAKGAAAASDAANARVRDATGGTVAKSASSERRPPLRRLPRRRLRRPRRNPRRRHRRRRLPPRSRRPPPRRSLTPPVRAAPAGARPRPRRRPPLLEPPWQRRPRRPPGRSARRPPPWPRRGEGRARRVRGSLHGDHKGRADPRGADRPRHRAGGKARAIAGLTSTPELTRPSPTCSPASSPASSRSLRQPVDDGREALRRERVVAVERACRSAAEGKRPAIACSIASASAEWRSSVAETSRSGRGATSPASLGGCS